MPRVAGSNPVSHPIFFIRYLLLTAYFRSSRGAVNYTVEDFLLEAFNIVDLDWKQYVETSEKYFRPNEVDYLLGDPSKIKKTLNWEPKTSFKELVKMMIENDLNEAEKELTLVKNNLLKPTWEHPTV